MLGMIGGFFFSRTGQIAMAVIAGMALFMYIRFDAKRDAYAQCEAESLRIEVAALKQQQAASENVAKSAVNQAALTQMDNDALQEKIDDIEVKLAANPACILTGDDIKRLQSLR